uniref:Uncharacterized protein n=1 Tax=Leersia perrieri TaxID=77586 RepID=A0A0D9WVR9_9ORYZ
MATAAEVKVKEVRSLADVDAAIAEVWRPMFVCRPRPGSGKLAFMIANDSSFRDVEDIKRRMGSQASGGHTLLNAEIVDRKSWAKSLVEDALWYVRKEWDEEAARLIGDTQALIDIVDAQISSGSDVFDLWNEPLSCDRTIHERKRPSPVSSSTSLDQLEIPSWTSIVRQTGMAPHGDDMEKKALDSFRGFNRRLLETKMRVQKRMRDDLQREVQELSDGFLTERTDLGSGKAPQPYRFVFKKPVV